MLIFRKKTDTKEILTRNYLIAQFDFHSSVSLYRTIVLLIIFSQYLGDVPVPFPMFKNGKMMCGRVYIFKLIPVGCLVYHFSSSVDNERLYWEKNVS